MGHSFEYAKALGCSLQDRGAEVIILSSQKVSGSIVKEFNVIPTFRYDFNQRFGLPALKGRHRKLLNRIIFQLHSFFFIQDLIAVNRRLKCSSDSIVLFHTINQNHLFPIIRWAERFPYKTCPKVVLVLRFTTNRPPQIAEDAKKYYRHAFRYLDRSSVNSRFFFFSDSELLVNEYRAFTRLPFHVLPIPHTQARFNRSNESRSCVPSGPICLSYLGDARMNKGFHFLPYLFKKMAPMLESQRICAEVQANIRDENDLFVKQAIKQLKRLSNIVLHENELSSSEYYALLFRSHIVILPYTLDYYHSQTSGIFGEALAWGKPVIVPRGTWMYRQSKQHGAGVGFLPNDRQDLCESVIKAVENYPALRTKAVEASHKWRSFHNQASYVEILFEKLKNESFKK